MDGNTKTSVAETETARFQSFAEFWPYYVREHSLATTRAVHVVGTTIGMIVLAAALILQQWWWLLAVPLCGYGFAWISHFFIEKNRPATFTYPTWSLLGDLKMWWLTLTGRMPAELRRIAASG